MNHKTDLYSLAHSNFRSLSNLLFLFKVLEMVVKRINNTFEKGNKVRDSPDIKLLKFVNDLKVMHLVIFSIFDYTKSLYLVLASPFFYIGFWL